MSGRCVPPLYGAFSTNTSPRRIVPARRSMIVRTLSPIEPRCTGMCGAFAIRLPSASNSAQLKSRRSLMLTDVAVLASVTPICSAIAMNRLLNTSSSTGSAVVPIACARLRGLDALEHEVVARRQRRAPARLDDRRRVGLLDDRRPVDRVARPQVLARVDVASRCCAGRVHALRRDRRAARPRAARTPAGDRPRTRCARSPRPRRLDHERLAGIRNRTAARSAPRTPRRRPPLAAFRTSIVVSVPSTLTCSVRRHAMRERSMPWRATSSRAGVSSASSVRAASASARFVERRLDRLLPQRAHVREPHPVRRQHARERMDEHARHAERVGDEAGVLPARAAEAAQRVLGDVVAALDADVLDRVRHVRDRDLEEPVGDRLGRAPRAGRALDLVGERLELAPHDLGVERRVAAGPEHLREQRRIELADHHVAVGHASGPPRRYDAGPGSRRADSGPTRKRAPSNVQIDPPPAATVWMRIIGARRRTPATSVTNARSYSPA
jgi:hypothetical protein